jgi:hypothetical protein
MDYSPCLRPRDINSIYSGNGRISTGKGLIREVVLSEMGRYEAGILEEISLLRRS